MTSSRRPPRTWWPRSAAVEAAGWPYIVDVEDGEVAGFAYATQIRDRAGYAWTAEDSLYVHPDQRGKGVGTSLLEELCTRAQACGFRQMIGVIGGAEPASVRVHARCGFREVGRAYGVGWKHGRWLDNVYMQRALGKGSREPPLKSDLGEGGSPACWGRRRVRQGFLCRSGRAASKYAVAALLIPCLRVAG